MGPATGAPARSRCRWAAPLLPLLPLLLPLLLAPSAWAAACPAYCSCNVTMQLFHHVSCERASMRVVPRQLPSKGFTTLLNMQRNMLGRLGENALDGFKQLQQLNVAYNDLDYIHVGAFRQCPALRMLVLAHNRLRALDPQLFAANRLLAFLDLSHNPLALPRAGPFLVAPALAVLNLSSAALSEVPAGALRGAANLLLLELRHNLLATLDARALAPLAQRNATLLLGDNPLRCDCALRAAWLWLRARPAPRPPPTCQAPERARDRPWGEALSALRCPGDAPAPAAAPATYALYAIAALLALIAVLVGLLLWALRRRRRRRAAAGAAGAGAGRKQRLAPAVGEYIDVVGDGPPPGKARPAAEGDADAQRYVMDVLRNTYLPPVQRDDGPLYENMRGPPLPLRRPSDAPPPPTQPPPPPPPAAAPAAAPRRPCSVPLLEGCDFYEVVD